MTRLDYLPWRRPQEYDDRPFVRDDTADLTYARFASWVDAAAEQLAELGVTPGSVVAIMLPNRVELLVAMVAAWRLGAAATPINPFFTANEANYQIADADAVVVINAGAAAPRTGRQSLGVEGLRRTRRGTGTLPEPATAPDDTALLVYTSGTTGRPKGVILSHGNIGAMTAAMTQHLAITGDDHCLVVLPLFHVDAICTSFLTPSSIGGRVTIQARFHPRTFLDAIGELGPTYFSAVPTILAQLVAQPDDVVTDTSSVRFAICGAAPASKRLLETTESRFGFPLVEGYGLTEATCAVAVNPPAGPRKIGTVGVALPGLRVAVMAPEGTFPAPGARGEVVIQGPTVMRGYLNRPDATAEAIRDGWLHTGDVGILDGDGYLRIVDRIKDMIIRGGENIYPKEIETVLEGAPGVLEAAVIGARDEVYGEVPVAYVVAHPGVTLNLDELTALCREQLTKIKVPATIHVLDALPKNPLGKVDKPALRHRSAAEAVTPRGG